MLIDIREIVNKLNVKCKGVIHLGAHKAEELKLYKNLNIKNVILYEANTKLINYLKIKSIAFNFLFKMNIKVINKVIYNKERACKLNITSSSQSNSILNLKLHKKYYPKIVKKKEILVEGNTLDNEFLIFYNIENYNILNMDIQGSELLALQGAKTILDKLDIIYTEVNYCYMYENCALIEELDSFLKKYNFTRYHTKALKDPNGKLAWGDAIYINKKLL